MMAVFITAAVCFGVLISVCLPFRRWHTAMLIIVPAAFCGAAWLLGGLFYICPLTWQEWLCMAGLIPGLLLALRGISALLLRLLARWSGGMPSMPRLRRAAAGIVLAASALYAVWLGGLLTDYLRTGSGQPPVFAVQQSDGSYSGLMYRVDGGHVIVFGREVTE